MKKALERLGDVLYWLTGAFFVLILFFWACSEVAIATKGLS